MPSGFRIDHAGPFGDAAGGQGFDAELAEHVKTLGAVVHAVGGDVGENGGAGEGVGFAVAGAGSGIAQRTAFGFGGQFAGADFQEGAQFGNGFGAFFFEARAEWLAGEGLRPGAHGGQDVERGVVQGAEAHLETLVELIGG